MDSGRVELETAVEVLERAVADLEPDELAIEAALLLLSLFARAGKVAEAGQALVARRLDATGAPQDRGHPSAAHLLAATAGVGLDRATTAVEVGRRLRDQPLTDGAFRRGALSLDQAGLISEAVEAVPDSERELVELAAREPVRTLRRRTREVRRCAESGREAVYARQRAARSFRHGRDRDGMVWGQFRLPPDTGVAVVNRIERATDRRYRAADREARHTTTHAQFAADALCALVSGASVIDERNAEVVVHASYDAIVRGTVENGEICRLESGDDIPVSVARELLENAFVKGILVDGTEVRRVKHFGRRIPAAVRTALHAEAMLRDGTVRCAAPGCDRNAGLQWHHRHPHARGGPTHIDNLEPLCGFDHRSEHRDHQPGAPP